VVLHALEDDNAIAWRFDLVGEHLEVGSEANSTIFFSIRRLDDCARVFWTSRMQTESMPRSAIESSSSISAKK
jgi:hypothetical protein